MPCMPSPDATPHWVNPSPGASLGKISNADFATPNFNLNPPCPQPPDTGPGYLRESCTKWCIPQVSVPTKG